MSDPLQAIHGLIRTEDGDFEGTILLPLWIDYISQEGREAGTVSDGNVQLSVYNAKNNDNSAADEIIPEQIVAYKYLIQDAAQIQKSILAELLTYYNESEDIKAFRQGMAWARQICGGSEEDEKTILPAVTKPEDFKNIIGLSRIHIHSASDDGFAQVGYEFDSWDIEHGLGVLMLRNQVLDIGLAETAYCPADLK